MNDFELQVKKGLENCGVSFLDSGVLPEIRIGIAVSGGADSVSLLLAVSNLFKNHKYPVSVITVNHNIREESETAGDADFVVQLCDELKKKGYPVTCSVVELEKGLVFKVAGERKAGIEEAARYLRYKAFEKFIAENNLDYLCLAHNRNDQLETLLMRFLQGSGVDGASGILQVRYRYIRPLLDISRKQIESYLTEKNQFWRTDKTNFDTNYLRNKIRNNIIPVFEKEFPEWERGVLAGARKMAEDSKVFNKLCLNVNSEYDSTVNEVSIDKESLMCAEKSIQSRVLLNACNKIADSGRIPAAFINDVLKSCAGTSTSFSKHFGNIEIVLINKKVFVKNHVKKQTDFIFFDIMEENGLFTVNGIDYIVKDSFLYLDNRCIGAIELPLCIRSFQSGDVVKTADRKNKRVIDIFSDWHVPDEMRPLIPVVQELGTESQDIKYILGSLFGYKDWIVKVL